MAIEDALRRQQMINQAPTMPQLNTPTQDQVPPLQPKPAPTTTGGGQVMAVIQTVSPNDLDPNHKIVMSQKDLVDLTGNKARLAKKGKWSDIFETGETRKEIVPEDMRIGLAKLLYDDDHSKDSAAISDGQPDWWDECLSDISGTMSTLKEDQRGSAIRIAMVLKADYYTKKELQKNLKLFGNAIGKAMSSSRLKHGSCCVIIMVILLTDIPTVCKVGNNSMYCFFSAKQASTILKATWEACSPSTKITFGNALFKYSQEATGSFTALFDLTKLK
jgi:hypothetical protein